MAGKTIKCLVNGKKRVLSEVAYKLAKRHFGAVSEEDLKLTKPVELTKPLIKPTIKPVIIKPAMKEVDVMVLVGDPVTEVTVTSVPDISDDPAGYVEPSAEPIVKKAPAKRKKK